MGCDVGQPLRIREVALSARDVFHVLGVAQPQLGEQTLQGVVERLPVHTGGLHGHPDDPGLGHVPRQLGDPPAIRREPDLGEGDLAVGPHRASGGHNVVPVHVQAGNRVQ